MTRDEARKLAIAEWRRIPTNVTTERDIVCVSDALYDALTPPAPVVINRRGLVEP